MMDRSLTIPDRPACIRYCMIGFFSYFGDARVRGYAELLRKGGNLVDVLGVHGSKADKTVDKSGVRLFSIPVSRGRKGRIQYLLQYSYSFFWLSFLLTKLYFENRYDVIHVHNMPDFLVFCGLIPKLFGAKIILDIHDPMPEVYLSKYPGKKNSLAMLLLHLEERISAAFVDAVIAANPHFQENLIARGIAASKITTVNNYPDPEIFHPSKRPSGAGKNHERFTLIFPGTIAPRYGLEVAIRALQLLIKEIPEIRLLIIGRQDEYARSLISLVSDLGLSPYVDFLPGLPNTEIPDLLIRADVGIYPALPDCHMSIAVPGKVLEFAIMGIPIVSSRLKIVEEMFDDSAVLFFEPGNSDDFAQCILKLYRDPALSEWLVARADQFLIQRQSRDREISAYFELLNRLLPVRRKSLSSGTAGSWKL